MKKAFPWKALLIIPFFVAACGSLPAVDPDNFQVAEGEQSCQEDARYLVTFIALWSAQTHPLEFPSNPHFSPLIGANHNSNFVLWARGELASEGIENMAENGRVSPLDSEIQVGIEAEQVGGIIRGSGVSPSPGQTSIDFTIQGEYSLVSLVTMVAPSPDWFLGIRDVDFCGEDGNWINEATFNLFTYDSGTDSGVSFASPDADTQPPENIRLLEEPPFIINGEMPPMGMFQFTRVDP